MQALKYLPIVIAVAITACGEKNTTKEPAVADATPPVTASVAPTPVPASAPNADAAPAAPVAAAAAGTPPATDLAQGEKVFGSTCQACHGTGVLGAPKVGDKAAWAPRIAQGIDTLHTHALAGVKMMPPKGGNAALKDDDVKAAVDYMVSKGS